jgi:hypothetical protein
MGRYILERLVLLYFVQVVRESPLRFFIRNISISQFIFKD